VKVRLLVNISGTRDGEDWPQLGETADLPAEEAASMIAAGMAEAVGRESAAVAAPETATVPKARKR
jgi:hypothetical protein